MVLDKYLKRDDVSNFIKEIKNNPRYNDKSSSEGNNYINMNSELALYIFYDALIKYKIIVDDIYLFDTFFDQMEKIYKKINTYNSMIMGINKLFCMIVSLHLNIKNLDTKESREQIIKFIYDKYIFNGYYVHGFSTVYEGVLKTDGFVSEIYENNYDRMREVDKIFEKYNVSDVFDKDFSSNKTYFTDDFIMGCYYSMMSPGYLSHLLFNHKLYGNRIRIDSYLISKYDASISYLKRFMSDNLFSEKDKKFILDTVLEEWKLLNKVNKRISLLIVHRNDIDNAYNSKLDDFLDDQSNIYDVVDRMLSPKYGNISFDGALDTEKIEIVSLDSFYSKNQELTTLDDISITNRMDKAIQNKEFLDTYGSAYIFLIIGALFISLGVIISILFGIRGI